MPDRYLIAAGLTSVAILAAAALSVWPIRWEIRERMRRKRRGGYLL